MKIKLTLALLILGTSLLPAELTRNEVSQKGGWTVSYCTDETGKFIQSEMVKTYNAKQETGLRFVFDRQGIHIDASGDWSDLGEAKAYPAAYYIDDASGNPAWKGKASVIEDGDGKPWLRISQPNEPGVGDGMANGKAMIIHIGPAGKDVEWQFDLKWSNASFKETVETYQNCVERMRGSGGDAAKVREKPAKAEQAPALIEHEYARPGDWGVHYYTNSKGNLVSASMIRYYDGGKMLRMTVDQTHFHLDTAAGWKPIDETLKGKPDRKLALGLVVDDPKAEAQQVQGRVIDDEGDKWFRISQSLDEPGGMEDAVRNGKTLYLQFTDLKPWSFDLKGSHAAWQKVDECMEKFSHTGK